MSLSIFGVGSNVTFWRNCCENDLIEKCIKSVSADVSEQQLDIRTNLTESRWIRKPVGSHILGPWPAWLRSCTTKWTVWLAQELACSAVSSERRFLVLIEVWRFRSNSCCDSGLNLLTIANHVSVCAWLQYRACKPKPQLICCRIMSCLSNTEM